MKTNIKINSENISLLNKNISVPKYDRSLVKAGIVHIGIGGFHRAHQALYTDNLLNNKQSKWGICGIGLLDFDKKICDTLKEQDGLYTLLTKELDGTLDARVIGALVEIIFAPENPIIAIEKMAHPDVKIISLTITEGGYNFNENTGLFDFNKPSIQWDLTHPNQPKTVFGYLTQALKLRKNTNGLACTIQSSDNIQGNGDMAKDMLLTYIKTAEPEILDWVKENVSFPNSMVDRITPVTVAEDIETLRTEFNIEDKWPVVCESFKQWVIEDDFIAGRPEWESVGAQFVEDVVPYENMKLRLLNAGHSVLGMLGALHGYNTIDEAASDTDFNTFLKAFMDNEVTPILGDLGATDLEAYKNSLIARFQNIYIKDLIARICLESSAKIPIFLLSTIKAQLQSHGHIARAAFVIAAWCKYNDGVDENGNTYNIEDAMSHELIRAAVESHQEPIRFLEIEPIFGDLVNNKTFVDHFLTSLEMLRSRKVKDCVVELNTKLN